MLIVRDYSTSYSEKFSGLGHNAKIVFFVWNSHGIRADTMSKHLGACLYFLYTSRIRHPTLFIKTLNILRKEKPKIIICQSPPINCALIALLYRFLFAKLEPKIIVDAHRGSFQAPWSRIKFMTRFVMTRADLTIVEDTEVQDLVFSTYSIKPIILEDPIPVFDQVVFNTDLFNRKLRNNKHDPKFLNVAVINPFTWDSPLQEILDAASKLRYEANFYLTGDFSKASTNLPERSENVVVTGFLPRIEYESLLKYVDVVIDLTLDAGRMQAGGYEAIAAGKPLIVSDNPPLRRYFNKGTVHTGNSEKEIIEAIREAREKKAQLEKEMLELSSEKQKEWQEKFMNTLIKTIKQFLKLNTN